MVALVAAAALMIVTAGAEWLHLRHCHRIASLAFGPGQKPRYWARFAPLLRIAAVGALVWGAITLWNLPPKIHKADVVDEAEVRHVILVLDVSPSMRLSDAGPTGQLSRMQRASELMESFFRRVSIQQYRLSVVAVYNGAKPVVIDTNDVDVVRNVLNDLPMHHAFEAGKTNIFDGLDEAIRIARPWRPRSANLILLSDGDTVPASGMPTLPASVDHVAVVGVGDPLQGQFIDGRQSRQETATLRQLATRLRGTYHNGNEHHLSTDLINQMTRTTGQGKLLQLTRREYALICLALSGLVFGMLPVALHFGGTHWTAGR